MVTAWSTFVTSYIFTWSSYSGPTGSWWTTVYYTWVASGWSYAGYTSWITAWSTFTWTTAYWDWVYVGPDSTTSDDTTSSAVDTGDSGERNESGAQLQKLTF